MNFIYPMEKYQNKYRIEPNRWQMCDYSSPASYFITICTINRGTFLGNIKNGQMILSEFGEIVKNEFVKIPQYNPRVILDEWVIMPNHVHCIITLGDWRYGADESAVEKINEFSLPCNHNHPKTIKQYRILRRKMLIPKILGKFQMQTSKQINILRGTAGQSNWQRDYHDHVIRDDAEFRRIRQYIIHNPAKWGEDRFNTIE